MSESKFEKISSLADNYRDSSKPNDELFEQLANDNVLSETWDRYHLIGDVLRDELPESVSLDLSAQIAQSIADEPTILAPKKSTIYRDVAYQLTDGNHF